MKKPDRRTFFLFSLSALAVAPFGLSLAQPTPRDTQDALRTDLVTAARSQIGVTLGYDGAYQRLDYPNGDIDRATGVCIDVVIRAYRDAVGFDFQKNVHEDMRAAFSSYPKIWGLSRTDKNIDHRRVPNIETYLSRQGAERPLPDDPADWRPGDIITMRLPGGLPHIAVISDRIGPSGRPYVIHNIGAGTREEDIIGEYDQERRFVFLPPARREPR